MIWASAGFYLIGSVFLLRVLALGSAQDGATGNARQILAARSMACLCISGVAFLVCLLFLALAVTGGPI